MTIFADLKVYFQKKLSKAGAEDFLVLLTSEERDIFSICSQGPPVKD
jgi:hypothetical protein